MDHSRNSRNSSPSMASVGRNVARNWAAYPRQRGGVLTVFNSQSTVTEDWRACRSKGSEMKVSPDFVTIRTRQISGTE